MSISLRSLFILLAFFVLLLVLVPQAQAQATSNKFDIGDKVEVVNGNVNVRATAGGTRVGGQSIGATGTVVGGPQKANGYVYWQINYDSGPDGWSAENWLAGTGVSNPSPSPSNKFDIGDKVEVVNGNVNVRATAGGTRVGGQSIGATGTVVGGPQKANGYVYWQINYDSGPDGWSAENWLAGTGVSNPPPPVTAGEYTVPQIQSLTTSGSSVTINWTLPSSSYGTPSGGFDFFIDGVDTNNTNRNLNGSATQKTLSNLSSGEHCFRVQARWLQADPSVFRNSGTSCVTVSSSTPPPTPTPPPISNKFNIGDTIETISAINVRATAGGTKLGSQPAGISGVVVEGPQSANGFVYWQINYSSGVDGWSAEDWLIRFAGSPPPPPPPPPPPTPPKTSGSFPRVASGQVPTGLDYGDANRMAIAAKHDLVILTNWPNYNIDGLTLTDVVNNLKAQNPNILVFVYVVVNELIDNPPWAPAHAKFASEKGANGQGDWYARKADGTKTSSWPNTFTLNHTRFTTPDENGDRLPAWYAKWLTEVSLSKADFDGVFIDVVNVRPLVTADWDENGQNETRNNTNAISWYAQGQVDFKNEIVRNNPGFLTIANVSEWSRPDLSIPNVYQGAYDGGWMEGIMGLSHSPETWRGWDGMMEGYFKTMDALGAQKMGLFHVIGEASDYKLMRYGLTSSLMGNGYFIYTPGGRKEQFWYDEYDIDLGKPIEGRQTTAWSKGLYRRDFENGIAIVNPKGNGTQTVSIEPGFKRFLGTQDSSHNNGNRATSITLQERDGILLIRE